MGVAGGCPTGTLCQGWRSGRADFLQGGNTTHERFIYEPAAASPYADEVLDLSPGGYWRFGEPSGTALLDSSPNANNGTYLGGVTLGAPARSSATRTPRPRIDGVNDTGRVPDSNSLDVGDVVHDRGLDQALVDGEVPGAVQQGLRTACS